MAKEETMISVTRELHTRIKKLADDDKRSMRAYLDVLITAEEKKAKR